MIDHEEAVTTHRESLISEAERIGVQLAAVPALEHTVARLAELPAFVDVAALSFCWDYYHKRPEIVLRLDAAHKDSPLLREIVAEFGGTIKKSLHYDGTSLNAVGQIENASLAVHSYLPASCQVVEEEYLVPASAAHMGTRKKIVCTQPVDPTEAV